MKNLWRKFPLRTVTAVGLEGMGKGSCGQAAPGRPGRSGCRPEGWVRRIEVFPGGVFVASGTRPNAPSGAPDGRLQG